jgi:phosphatidylglycerol:prolipoprotein diacylglycerol transferase
VTFPFYFHFGGFRVHPHLVMELIGYAAGFQLYLHLRRRAKRRGEAMPVEANLWLIVGCVLGAMVGSKMLAWIESINQYWPHRADPRAWLGGKTIVGGLLGGWIGVEIVKKRLRITRSTGDLFVFPLILGMSIGRIGCFLTGLDDQTCGVATSLPWGVDFGDGIRRHPAQLYDIVLLSFIALACLIRLRKPSTSGRMFRFFVLGYLSWRFAVEFIKPREIQIHWLNLSAIQIASLTGALICAWLLLRGKVVPDENSLARQPAPTGKGMSNEVT